MKDVLKVARLTFKAGSAPGQLPLAIDCPNVTILVGPNNAGKSRTLREIHAKCANKEIDSYQLLDSIELSLPDRKGIAAMMKMFEIATPPGNTTVADHTYFQKPSVKLNEQQLLIHVHTGKWFEGWADDAFHESLRSNFVQFFTILLDGRTRFDLTDPKATGSLEEKPQNHLWALFLDKDARQKVRKFTQDAFAKFFVVDPTGMTQFRIRLSKRAPKTEAEEQALDSEARAFHADADLLSDLGDGVKTSVGLVSAVMSLPDRILLIDEPEAFLHPTLSRRVGSVLAQTARERNATLVVATHSADFLLGCMQTAPELRIVRLTHDLGRATSRSIEPARVRELMSDPLLRSAHAMRGLFHRGVIVCEADADRAFYDEVNARLVMEHRGIEDALFLNAQNWQTIPRIALPLRSLGVPAASIMDFDVLMDNDFAHIWPLLGAQDAVLKPLQVRRDALAKIMASTGRKDCKKLGIGALPEDSRDDAKALIDDFARYGVFFVTSGELECWLNGVRGITKIANKTQWLLNTFAAMGADPDDAHYLTPANDDVWGFIETIKRWIDDPHRLGIPN
ncbi:ATP-dependent nuclease [Bombella apis]|uniref:AAA family ATPase n=1 Tax=Bombella apis TaxID=1785988 RepID=A0ABR9MNQ1_9PROT|nr:AAA family ATPase [Bombella apis]MBE1723486.1 AAA family ATPase [Bombella apis]MBR9730265.1 AAA family ATPase [Bombella apis]